MYSTAPLRSAARGARFGLKQARLFLLAYPAVFVLALVVGIPLTGCKTDATKNPKDEKLAKALKANSRHELTRKYSQNFEHPDAINDFFAAPTSTEPLDNIGETKFKIQDGRLIVEGRALEYPDPESTATLQTVPRGLVWLDKHLPHTFRAEMKIEALDEAKDMNVYFAGDGTIPTGYEVMIAGQDNKKHALYLWMEGELRGKVQYHRARFGSSYDMIPVAQNRQYDLTIERDGKRIRVWLDGTQILDQVDEHEVDTAVEGETGVLETHSVAPNPRDSHRRLGLSTWDNKIAVDDLKIVEIDLHEDLNWDK